LIHIDKLEISALGKQSCAWLPHLDKFRSLRIWQLSSVALTNLQQKSFLSLASVWNIKFAADKRPDHGHGYFDCPESIWADSPKAATPRRSQFDYLSLEITPSGLLVRPNEPHHRFAFQFFYFSKPQADKKIFDRRFRAPVQMPPECGGCGLNDPAGRTQLVSHFTDPDQTLHSPWRPGPH